MAIKKIIEDKPNYGDISQYNFPDDYTANQPNYNDSISLPDNNGKFEKKDLQTSVVGSEINDKIIENNLKFEGLSFIKIDNIVIDNSGVNYDVKSIRVRAFLFDQRSYGRDPLQDSYGTLVDQLNADSPFKFYDKSFSGRNEGQGLGNITDMEGTNIISDFGVFNPNSASLGDFPGTNFNTDGAFTPSTENPPTTNKFIEEIDENPLFIAVWMRGNAKRWWGTDRRKRRIQIYQINNLDLFNNSGGTITGKVVPIVFDNGNADSNRTGGGGSGGAEAAAFKITSFSITINTISGTTNDAVNDEYAKTFLSDVLAPSAFDLSNNRLFFENSPNQQLNNTSSDGSNQNYIFPEYFPTTTFGLLQKDGVMADTDLQSYYSDFSIDSLNSSSPATVTFDVSLLDTSNGVNNPTTYTGDFLYFVIDWNDTEDKFKTIEDYLDSKPQNLIELLDLQSKGLYTFDRTKIKHTYTSPGIKVVKFITITFDTSNSNFPTLGRWKLGTARFFLNIPLTEYPDFSEVGGSDYTTIPWPFTTPIIGGVDEDSRYKISVQDSLSSGNIGDTDIIDERFLINDLENDEMGKSIDRMDLEQCRYFNKPHGINHLLKIPIVEGTSEIIYDTNINFFSDIDVAQSLGYDSEVDPNFLATLPFPEYFEQFNVSQGSSTPIIDSVDAMRWNGFYSRPDVSSLILYLIGDIEFPTEYTYPFYVNAWSTIDDIPIGTIYSGTYYSRIYNDFDYWNGESAERTYSEDISVQQIFINDNQDLDLKQSCKLELNTGEMIGKSIYDSSGNSNKGLLIGDYKVKKVRKGEPMRRDSFIKVPKKTDNSQGAL